MLKFATIPIGETVQSHFRDIGQSMEDHDVTFENGQARERTQVLMDLANQRGGIVVGTGDLSELALGWATYNGDHMSMYGVNASIPKTLVRHLVDYVARESRDAALTSVLRDILDTPVSPELLPPEDGQIAQKTEDLVGPYTLHDFFLYYAIRWAFRRPRSTAWPDTPWDSSLTMRPSSVGSRPSTVGSSPSSSSAAACRTAPRWAPPPCLPGVIGGCPRTRCGRCGAQSWRA